MRTYVFIMVWNNLPELEKIEEKLKSSFDGLGDALTPQPSGRYRKAFRKYAYLYRHFTATSYGVKEVWGCSSVVKIPMQINVCCIGGGPGCDLVGLMMWLKEEKFAAKIKGVILDSVDWMKHSRCILQDIDLGNEYNLKKTRHVDYNFFQSPMREDVQQHLANADIITIVMVLGSIVGTPQDILKQLKEILKLVKIGAMIQFMDKDDGRLLNLVDQAAHYVGLKCLLQVRNLTAIVENQDVVAMNAHAFPDLLSPEKAVTMCGGIWKNMDLSDFVVFT